MTLSGTPIARNDFGKPRRAFRSSISAARSALRISPIEAASRSYLSPTWPALKRTTGGSRTALISDPEFHKREATLLASRNAQPDDFAEVVRQMKAGKVPTHALNTHRGRLDYAPALFREWLRPEAGVIKAILEV